MCQAGHKHHRNGWRIGSPAPYTLKNVKPRLQGLPLHNKYIPFDDMLQPSAARFQRRLEVLKDLLSLRRDIAFANDLPGSIDGILSPDIDGLCRTCHDDCLAKCWIPGKCGGVKVLHTTRNISHVGVPSLELSTGE